MKITLPIANGKTLTFDGFDKLAEHYGTMSNAYLKKENPKAEAYAIVAWQLSPSNGFRMQLDVPQGWEVRPQQDDPNLWSAYKDGEFRAGMFGSQDAVREWIEKYTKVVDRHLRIKYVASSVIGGEYNTGTATVKEDDLVAWIFEKLRQDKPVLITDMDEV